MWRLQVVRRSGIDGEVRPSHFGGMARTPTASARPACRLYLITPPAIPDLAAFARDLEASLAAGDVAALQIRFKDIDDAAVLEAVAALSPIGRAHGVAVILNDRPDLAVRAGCDGVHVGQSDASVSEARRIMGPDAMIGATCHDSRHLAMEAAEAGADYVAFGAFFPTATKATTHHPEPDILTIWQETMEVPCVAIGGVTAANAGGLAAAGADFIAVSAAVWSHPQGPMVAVRELNQALVAAS
jgi:thiamine-phosphate pyrophosphorylase